MTIAATKTRLFVAVEKELDHWLDFEAVHQRRPKYCLIRDALEHYKTRLDAARRRTLQQADEAGSQACALEVD